MNHPTDSSHQSSTTTTSSSSSSSSHDVSFSSPLHERNQIEQKQAGEEGLSSQNGASTIDPLAAAAPQEERVYASITNTPVHDRNSTTEAPERVYASITNTPSTSTSNNSQERVYASITNTPIIRNTSRSRSNDSTTDETNWSEFSHSFEENIGKPSRQAIHKFFYPTHHHHHHHHHRHHHQQEHLHHQQQQQGEDQSHSHSQTQSETALEASAHSNNSRDDLGHRHHHSHHDSDGDDDNDSHEDFSDEEALHNNRNNNQSTATIRRIGVGTSPFEIEQRSSSLDEEFQRQEEEDRKYVERFWTTYDDIIILSLFTQLGVVFRLAAATWFTVFDGIFKSESPLFTNLPLNCLSCFIMGLLAPGDKLMEIIVTRFTPTKLQQQIQHLRQREEQQFAHLLPQINYHQQEDDEDDDDNDDSNSSHHHQHENEINGLFAQPAKQYKGQNGYSSPQDHHHRGQTTTLRQRKRRPKKQKLHFHSWEPPVHIYDDLREVQLFALERRIRASKCLLLFPIKKEDQDVLEHYFDEGYKKKRTISRDPEGDGLDDVSHSSYEQDERFYPSYSRQHQQQQHSGVMQQFVPYANMSDLALDETVDQQSSYTTTATTDVMGEQSRLDTIGSNDMSLSAQKSPPPLTNPETLHGSHDKDQNIQPLHDDDNIENQHGTRQLPHRIDSSDHDDDDDDHPDITEQNDNNNNHNHNTSDNSQRDLDQIIHNVSANVSQNVSRFRRVNLADGWDVGTEPESMSDDLMLGLRDGFCGALSSFSSWNSAMVNLLWNGHIGEAIVGYMLGLQLPIVAYRFGQHVAVYIFVWRCRRETKKDETRGGYGIRVRLHDTSEVGGTDGIYFGDDDQNNNNTMSNKNNEEDDSGETPSVRAICTAIFIMALVTQCTSLNFFPAPTDRQIALSLLFSPFGVLARWRLSKYNSWRPSFPIGTFTCNILACALSGSLGSLLAGNPGPEERIVLQSFIAGFGGTLSSLATFVVEILSGIDPLLFRMDGFVYAISSIFWALVVGFVFNASVEWADETHKDATAS